MPPDDDPHLFESTVLETILHLHPEHLTISELVLRMAGALDEPQCESLREAIRDLRGSGLVQYIDGVVAPTHPAVRAAELLTWP
jgi:hypothetical protein